MSCCVPKVKAFPDATVISLADLKAFGQLPTYASAKSKLKNMNNISLQDTFMVFISHAWLRDSHPDNEQGEKFQLLVQGVSRLKDDLAPDLAHCHVWLDFACLKKSEKKSQIFASTFLDIIAHCDCMFTPLVDHLATHWELEYTPLGYFHDYKASSWNGGKDSADPKCYLNRSWCRIESFCCANAPLHGAEQPSFIAKISKYRGCLKRLADAGSRPHFIYGHREQFLDIAPLNLAHLQNTRYEEWHPMKGQVTDPEDKDVIALLARELEARYAKDMVMGYVGDYDELGHQNGTGRYLSAKHDVYRGGFKNNKRHGQGVFFAPNGDCYDGGWEDNQKSGGGEMFYLNGNVYSGHWSADQMEGPGTLLYARGPHERYEGQWAAGKRSGQGKCTFRAGGDILEIDGSWSKNQTKGKCHITYADGSIYDGETTNAVRHGKGQLTTSAGKYKGDFKTGQFSGRGHMVFSCGDIYNGEWSAGEMEGRGSLQRGGEEFDGHFRRGRKCGQGKMTYRDGTVYVGEWRDDMRQGSGKLISADEKVVQKGEWAQDKLVET